ncbi:Fe(3+)-hydroxamate ABC transporter substrate-binding protein FhuD [Martelella alba]|uniref:Fe(3+)-hydroxamate ABC transporter substrate-binding protein FhuD n=1 Tax=Martelella alba TaxID=2590451 RepID=UPI001E57B7BF|nr:Fe(3+)-hydroxamate ABC transporter substrate-binding protein FhuD [Martelella alba]
MCTHDVYRRNLIKGLLLAPWCRWKLADAARPPDINRIIALEWRPAELLLALGVMPLAVADIPNYRRWVEEPVLAPSVVDVGLRNEPNLEAIKRLHPSLILLSRGYGPDPGTMNMLAPALSFPFGNPQGLPFTQARRDVLTLGDYLGLADRAKRHLHEVDRQVAQTRQRLSKTPGKPLLLFSFIDSGHVLVIGKRSLLQEVMDEVGVENAWQGEVNSWGSTVVGIERLAQMRDVRAFCFHRGERDPLNEAVHSPLWRILPFVREKQWRVVPAIWFYGATLAAMRFCRHLEAYLEPTRES